MRAITLSLIVAGMLGSVVVSARQDNAARVLAEAREALGGEAALAAVKSFSVGGSYKRNVGARNIESALEIDCELPGKFVRTTTQTDIPVLISQREGFNGDEPIREVVSPDRPELQSVIRTGPSLTAEQLAAGKRATVARHRQRFAQLALGMFATSSPTYPIEFVYGGQAPIKDGVADVLEGTSVDGFALRLFVDVKTHLPVMITWQAKPMVTMAMQSTVRVSRSPGAPPTVTSSPGIPAPVPAVSAPGTVTIAAPPPPGDPTIGLPLQEHQLVFADYRTADGVRWPHVITEYVEGQMAEETRLGKFKINPKINANRFRVATQ